MVREAIKDLREIAADIPTTGPRQLKDYPFLPHLQGSSIAYDARGQRLLVTDPYAGTITSVHADTLEPIAVVDVCQGPEQVIATPTGAVFVTCRYERRVVALDADLAVTGSATVGPEPFGLAASRRGGWLYVTTAGDSRLHRLAARTLSLSFSRQLRDGARGVGVTRDGKHAIVAHLTGRTVSLVDLQSDTTHDVRLPARRDGGPGELLDTTFLDDIPRRDPGAAFAVAISPGGTRAFVPYALRNPAVVGGVAMQDGVCGTSYGADTPLIASVAAVDLGKRWVQRPKLRELPEDEWSYGDFMGMSHQSELGVVRAAVHDPRRSRLLVAGEGSGLVVAFDTSTADPTASPRTAWSLNSPARGIAIAPDGRRAFVHLAIDRQIAVLDLAAANADADDADDAQPKRVYLRPEHELQAVERGRRLFYQANDERTSAVEGVGCASCHLEGRSDGITWALGDKVLQTPVLSGRLQDVGPYRWHGDSPDLEHAVGEAIQRLNGDGLADSDTDDLLAYLRSGAPDIALPARRAAPAQRGREVFEAQGCASCHDPDRNFSDGQVHSFRGGQYRTPSLIGVARSAPYYHDGSARSLRAVVDAHEPDNPMAVGGDISREDRRALLKYLYSL